MPFKMYIQLFYVIQLTKYKYVFKGLAPHLNCIYDTL